jgi:hypothetical protein
MLNRSVIFFDSFQIIIISMRYALMHKEPHYITINKGDFKMLATDKLSGAFKAICEEAQKLQKKELPTKVQRRLETIISIAKHQSDIRGAKKGNCKSKTKCGSH